MLTPEARFHLTIIKLFRPSLAPEARLRKLNFVVPIRPVLQVGGHLGRNITKRLVAVLEVRGHRVPTVPNFAEYAVAFITGRPRAEATGMQGTSSSSQPQKPSATVEQNHPGAS